MQGRRAQFNSAIATLLAVAVLSIVAILSIRLAWSDSLYREAATESVSEAIRISPDNADHYLGLATLLEMEGEDPRGPLREAIRRKPLDAAIWIRLGLQEEIHGQMEEAERRLLEAARLSRKYDARWTLANFYFRQNRADEFWRWARKALRVSYGDRTPLFRLCEAMEPDPGVIFERAIPERREVRRAWVHHLFGTGENMAAASIVRQLLSGMVASEAAFFLGATDSLLTGGLVSSALEIWNALCEHGWIDRLPLDPAGGEIVSNSDLHSPALGRGFDWRIPSTNGVFVSQRPGEWRISFSGNQPEDCTVLSQYVPLAEGRRYRFLSNYRSEPTGISGENRNSGIRWSLVTLTGERLAESEPMVVDGDGESTMSFAAPSGAEGARLILRYRRASGSVRTEGSLTLQRVTIQGG